MQNHVSITMAASTKIILVQFGHGYQAQMLYLHKHQIWVSIYNPKNSSTVARPYQTRPGGFGITVPNETGFNVGGARTSSAVSTMLKGVD